MRSTYEPNEPERVETVIIGAGQAGLSVAYHLARRGRRFVVLEANDRIGDNWRTRWDSLRLFTPARFDSLDGMPFPAKPFSFPTKDEMADYLASYAEHFELPVRTGMGVTEVSRTGDRYLVRAGDVRFSAEHVVVAMATFQKPMIPSFATDLDPSIVQLHSSEYKNLKQLQPGGVLIVGAGNSGAELGLETARGGHETWISGRDVGKLPYTYNGVAARAFMTRVILRGVFHRVMTTDTPIGRKVRPKMLRHSAPLIRVRPNQLARLGVKRVGRTVRAWRGKPEVEGGQVLDAANVIWCTGFHPGFDWIDLPIFDADHQPVHDRGVVRGEPGLYFVGLHFLYAMSSTMIHGVGRDADFVAGTIEDRARSSSRSAAYAAVGA